MPKCINVFYIQHLRSKAQKSKQDFGKKHPARLSKRLKASRPVRKNKGKTKDPQISTSKHAIDKSSKCYCLIFVKLNCAKCYKFTNRNKILPCQEIALGDAMSVSFFNLGISAICHW